jgi:hypothetical protein
MDLKGGIKGGMGHAGWGDRGVVVDGEECRKEMELTGGALVAVRQGRERGIGPGWAMGRFLGWTERFAHGSFPFTRFPISLFI